MMFDFFAKSKKTPKTVDNDGGERQETSSSTSSLTDCPSDNAADGKSVQNPNESETSAASDQPNTSRKKKLKSDLSKKFGREIINNL